MQNLLTPPLPGPDMRGLGTSLEPRNGHRLAVALAALLLVAPATAQQCAIALPPELAKRVVSVDFGPETPEEAKRSALREQCLAEVRAAHPDLKAIVGDADFHAWVAGRPKNDWRTVYWGLATPVEIIDVLSLYKKNRARRSM